MYLASALSGGRLDGRNVYLPINHALHNFASTPGRSSIWMLSSLTVGMSFTSFRRSCEECLGASLRGTECGDATLVLRWLQADFCAKRGRGRNVLSRDEVACLPSVLLGGEGSVPPSAPGFQAAFRGFTLFLIADAFPSFSNPQFIGGLKIKQKLRCGAQVTRERRALSAVTPRRPRTISFKRVAGMCGSWRAHQRHLIARPCSVSRVQIQEVASDDASLLRTRRRS